ncbi:MAG: SRPBCC domain-containing protein [Trueperaceae bacterium]|nr:SRPBCC domain-containing protein [Trueperaceae bacterium]
MAKRIQREILVPQPVEQVWLALADSDSLAQWMFPNNFEPYVGHHFCFHVPPKPEVGFDGMVVRCEVLECESPSSLAFTWSVDGLSDTRVSFRLEPDGDGTRIRFEHSGFDVSQWGEHAIRGAEYGWASMLKKLPDVAAGLVASMQEKDV